MKIILAKWLCLAAVLPLAACFEAGSENETVALFKASVGKNAVSIIRYFEQEGVNLPADPNNVLFDNAPTVDLCEDINLNLDAQPDCSSFEKLMRSDEEFSRKAQNPDVDRFVGNAQTVAVRTIGGLEVLARTYCAPSESGLKVRLESFGVDPGEVGPVVAESSRTKHCFPANSLIIADVLAGALKSLGGHEIAQAKNKKGELVTSIGGVKTAGTVVFKTKNAGLKSATYDVNGPSLSLTFNTRVTIEVGAMIRLENMRDGNQVDISHGDLEVDASDKTIVRAMLAQPIIAEDYAVMVVGANIKDLYGNPTHNLGGVVGISVAGS